MTDFRLPPACRLRSSDDFERVYALRIRAADSHLLLFAAPNQLGLTRAGQSVSRKQGNSVRRHRLKRLLREAFRLARPDLPCGLDLVLIPQPNTEARVATFGASLRRLVEKLEPRLSSLMR